MKKDKCLTCNGSKKVYVLTKGYNNPAYAPPEAIIEIPCPDCSVIEEIDNEE